MSAYNVHAGHCPQGQGASGAVGILKESVEDRLVKNEVIRLLREEGHTVYDCTCDVATTPYGCLQKIVAKCNQHSVALDISIHLNSGRNDYKGDKSTGGVEVWNYDTRTKSISERICKNISTALNIRNRGTKYSKNLYVLNNTNSLALLVECCFVDDKDDANAWDYKKCAKAITEGILNKKIGGNTMSTPKQNPGNPLYNEKRIWYRGHASKLGWLDPVRDGQVCGTVGFDLPLEAIKIDVTKLREYVSKNITVDVKAHIENVGWKEYKNITSDTVVGTTGKGQRIEALQIFVNNLPKGKYFFIRTQIEDYGWTDWIGNGYTTGTVGIRKAIEALQMKIA